MFMINTKRIFTALLLAVIAVTGYAYDFEVDGIYYCYDVYGNAVVTHGNKKYTGKIKIPSEVKWNGKKKKVVEIGDYAFECCYELKSVSIPSSVYYIGRFAFHGCISLETISFAKGNLKSMGREVFKESGIKHIVLPEGITELPWLAFSGCKKLTNIVLPTTLKAIGCSAFEGCSSLKKVVFPKKHIEIDKSAFSGCYTLTEIVNKPKALNLKLE